MPATKLTHDTLGNLQAGAIGAVIDDAINRCMQDCESRSGLDKDRTVTIKVSFRPVLNKGLDGQEVFSTVAVKPSVTVSTPAQAAGPEFLHVSPGVTANGEPETAAVFSQEGLFVARKEGN